MKTSLNLQARPHESWLSCLLAFALALSLFSQLRPNSLPIGPGELVALVWLSAATCTRLTVNANVPFPRSPLFLFWVVSGLALIIGLANALARGLLDETNATRDLIALSFVAVITTAATGTRSGRFFVKNTLATTFVIVAIFIAGLLLVPKGTTLPGGLDPWYARTRFTALCKNPNQLGLLCSFSPYLLWSMKSTCENRLRRLVLILSMVVIIIAGLLTKSDALYVAWAVSLAVALTRIQSLKLQIVGWIGLVSAGISCVIFGFGLMSAPNTLLGPGVLNAATAVYSDGDQGSIRLTLWEYGTKAALNADALGLGPGKHAGRTGPNQGFEAHNTMIDWFSMTGILGLLALIILCYQCFYWAKQSRSQALLCALAALLTFATFHFCVRQPLFHLALAHILMSSRHQALHRQS